MRIFIFILVIIPGIIAIEPYNKIATYLKEYIKNGVHQEGLTQAVNELKHLNNATFRSEQICNTCRYVIDGVIKFQRSGVSKEDMLKLIKYLCNTFSDHGPLMCNSMADMEIDAMLFMINNRKNLTADRVCSIYLQNHLCVDPDEYDWVIDLPTEPNKKDSVNINDKKPFKILHLTDIHVDPDYKPGSDADCGKPLCCQSGVGNNSETTAGFWGDYHVCDMPWHSVSDLLQHVTTQHSDVKYVYFTGDIIAHTWKTTKESNTKVIQQLSREFKKYFKSTKVFPILGNHEAHPCDYYAPLNVSLESVSTQWLFDMVSSEWSEWLPESAQETLKIGGYYTVLVEPGFRIIALNSNVCYIYNLWLVHNDYDQYSQLKWLVETLTEAEKKGEFVHILSHIPPGGIECWKIWLKNFNRIIRRFSKNVRAQFNGHTHLDEIRIFLDETKSQAVNVAYNGGSFTTFIGNNPNYRVYDISPENDVIDYQEYIYNLTEANRNPNSPPNWFKLYSFKEAYGLKSTNLSDLYDLTLRMKKDPEKLLLKQYYKFYTRESDVKMTEPCNSKCLDNLMCSITGVDFKDSVKCQ
ncbi:sphingomyelin phosphodiesterase-like [Onthophagus taurus]|uniref:sphingomyelin phosphodiesterase-like n=1 Tax=Onthophagus taurus TaxID=166361 RepID=UPI0039BECF80